MTVSIGGWVRGYGVAKFRIGRVLAVFNTFKDIDDTTNSNGQTFVVVQDDRGNVFNCSRMDIAGYGSALERS